jgi:hypothetical protein
MPATTPRELLYEMAEQWEREARRDVREQYPYQALLDELLFQGELRFQEYVQFSGSEGPFVARLYRWVNNVRDERHRKTMLRSLAHLLFVDRRQMTALARDAYRRVITQWLIKGTKPDDICLAPDYERRVRSLLSKNWLFSITDSFSFPEFIRANSLTGLPKALILGENPTDARERLPSRLNSRNGAVVLEDFVGTGNQARGVLAVIQERAAPTWPIIFVPLLILESGYKNLRNDKRLSNVTVEPVAVISDLECLSPAPQAGEPAAFVPLRSLTRLTAGRVLAALAPGDEVPPTPFGYGESGALAVTFHNAPNNTLPLLHHRAPTWDPLFRRISHSYDGL